MSETSDYYDHQNTIYQEVWNAQGRMCWGYYPPEQPAIKFEAAGQKHVERMAAMVPFDGNSKVLELGCGNGVTAIWLAQKFDCQVVGIDPSQTNINNAKKLAIKLGVTDKVTFIALRAREQATGNGEQ